ncbi:MAG: urease accessory protein [Bacteroidetes bacterium]|nr:urease accessory protein [Bacteroidota bacterium]
MVNVFPLLFAAVVGFTHAFEVDHLLAVSSIVTRRKSMMQAAQDGIYWGLGHTSTILIVGMMMLLAKIGVAERTFHLFESLVGLMLIALGLHRLWRNWSQERAHTHAHEKAEPHHHLAYGIGLIHGLAGSGAIVLLAMTELKDPFQALLYLFIFGTGSIAGMLLASGIFSFSLTRKLAYAQLIRLVLTMLSSVLCIAFGLRVLEENWAFF